MLLIVTLVLASLSLSGAALLVLMKAEREATDTRGLSALVKGVDRSAVVFLIAAVESTQEEREKFGGLYNNPGYFCAAPLLTLEEGGEDASRFTVISPEFTDSKIEGIRYGLVDESSRLNLEAALAWEAESPGAGRDALMKLPGMTAIAADSILDWIDPDETPRANGGEAKYYKEKKLPYSPRNAVPVFLEELLLARGVTRSQLYGTDENFTYNIDKIEQEEEQGLSGSLSSPGGLGGLDGLGLSGLGGGSSARSENNESHIPWKELLTVFSAEKDVDPKGEARVDLNAANMQFLYQELQSRVGADLAKFIILYRQYGPQVVQETQSANGGGRNASNSRRRSGYAVGAGRAAANAADLNVAADGSPLTPGALSSAQLDLEREPTASLKTPLDLVGARVVVGNVVYTSPIPDDRKTSSVDALFQLLDYCSTSSSTTIVGRVNINVAPKVVLSAIPGVDGGLVQTIMTRRPDPSKALPDDFRHASWLYAKGVVDLEKMKELYNKTTSQGDVYRGQVVGFLDNSDEMARAEVVVDGTTLPPRQVFYKDLTTLGKGFSHAVLLGGLTGGAQQGLASNAAENQTQLVDIRSERTSGYSYGAPTSYSSDPFAAVDTVLNETTLPMSPPSGDPNAPQDALPVASAAPASPGTVADTSAEPAANLGQGGPNDPLDPEYTAQSAEPAQESRKERLLNALRSAREDRQARYQALSSPSAEAEPEEEIGNESAPDTQNASGGRGGRN